MEPRKARLRIHDDRGFTYESVLVLDFTATTHHIVAVVIRENGFYDLVNPSELRELPKTSDNKG